MVNQSLKNKPGGKGLHSYPIKKKAFLPEDGRFAEAIKERINNRPKE